MTVFSCRREGGLDVVLRDRPPDQDDVAAPRAAYLPRGPEGCVLGMSAAELTRQWKLRQAPPAGRPVVLTPPEGSPYDALLVWLEGGRVARVVARHRAEEAQSLSAAAAGQAVTEAWGRQAAELGWPRRQETGRGGSVQSWANRDDATQVRVFWQQNRRESPRVYTEWTELP
jgi:hypothetical protein